MLAPLRVENRKQKHPDSICPQALEFFSPCFSQNPAERPPENLPQKTFHRKICDAEIVLILQYQNSINSGCGIVSQVQNLNDLKSQDTNDVATANFWQFI
jgi:hypothetical protein